MRTLMINITVQVRIFLRFEDIVDNRQLADLFVLKFSGWSSTSPSRLPRIFVENQPLTPNIRVLNIGASTVFIKVWPL